MSANQKFTLGCIGLILIACFGCAVIVLATYVVSPVPTVVEQYPPAVNPRQTEIVPAEPTSQGWVGDDFGPEQAFPAVIVGPAIAEIKGSAGYCALVNVNEGETLNWRGGGAWWQAYSQAALEARFPHHKAEYAAKWPKCSIFEHAYDVK